MYEDSGGVEADQSGEQGNQPVFIQTWTETIRALVKKKVLRNKVVCNESFVTFSPSEKNIKR
jgi:hypothetical protein